MRASFSMCQSLIFPLFLTYSLLDFCDGFRNDFYLVYTSILAPILAPIFELLGSSIAFVGDQKLARFGLSFFVVFDPKMAPKSDPKTVHKNHFFAPQFKTPVSDPPWPILGPIWAPFGSHLASLLDPILTSIRTGSLPGRPGPRNGSKLPRLTRQSDTSGPPLKITNKYKIIKQRNTDKINQLSKPNN